MSLSRMKFLAAVAVGGAASLVQGAVLEIAAGDVVALTNALSTYSTSATTLKLAPGDYDLTGIQMEEEGSDYGKTHLLVSGVHITGSGEKPEDVRLIGDGTCRVYRMIPNTYAVLKNLTITNGYAKTIEGKPNSKNGGGIYGYPTVTNCVITGCKADGYGGGTYSYTYIRACRIMNNTAYRGGGAYQPNEVINSLVSGNSATHNGGGIYGGDSGWGSAYGSTITGNTSGNAGGGIFKVNTVSNCVISLNVSVNGGGGINGGGGRGSRLAYDCTICSNRTTGTEYTASGAAYEYTLVRGKIFANYARHGGGASYCTLTDVEVYDNCAIGYGGGVYNCDATNCVIRNNFFESSSTGTGANSYGSVLYGCDISGTGVDGGRAVNCEFHDIVNHIVLEGNPYVSDVSWKGHVYYNIPVCTNCLFRDNFVTNYSHSLFCGVSEAKRPGSIVNCTAVSNKYGKTFSYMTTEAFPVQVKNCVFFGNRAFDSDSVQDIRAWENVSPEGLRFANCAYGTAAGLFAAGKTCDIALCADGPMYKFGADGFGADPRFSFKDEAHPFEPRRTSPLLGLGLVEDWMASGTDIRGDGYPRLRDGSADIGCYQCWIKPVGAVISVR